LLQTIVEGITAPAIPNRLRSWKLSSTSDTLPYRLTIIYDTFVPRDQNVPLQLAAPKFTAARIGQTLLSMSNAGESVKGEQRGLTSKGRFDESSLPICGPGDAELVRIRGLAQAIEAIAAAQYGTLPPATVAEIFTRFESSFQAEHRSLQKAAESDEVSESLLEQAAASLEAVRKARQRLEHTGLRLNVDAMDESVSEERPDADAHTIQYLKNGDDAEIEVQRLDGPNGPGSASLALVILVLGGAAALVVIPTARTVQHPVTGNSSVQLAAIGLVWWLLAPMGWLGLLFIGVAAIGLLRMPRPAMIREGGSSLLKPTSK
jgi:hypothetical protein